MSRGSSQDCRTLPHERFHTASFRMLLLLPSRAIVRQHNPSIGRKSCPLTHNQNMSKERCRCSGRGYPCSKEGTVLGCPCKQSTSHRPSPPPGHPAAGLATAGSRKVAPGSGFPSAGAAVATKPCAGWKRSQENRRAGKGDL